MNNPLEWQAVSAARSQRSRRHRPAFGAAWKDKAGTLLLGAIVPIAALICWQLLGDYDVISRLLFPTPLTILRSFRTLIANGVLLEQLEVSVARAAAGFALGGALGLLFGLAVGLFRNTERALDPSFQMIRMVPHLAIAPLFILWFGLGETSKMMLIAKGAFFPLYVNTFLGVRSADNKLFEVSRVLAFSGWKRLTRLVLPSALPNIFLGIRLSLGVAWLGLVVAELMGSSSGIGYMMSDARQFSKTPVVFVGIITFALVGKAADSLVRMLEKRLLAWRDSYGGD